MAAQAGQSASFLSAFLPPRAPRFAARIHGEPWDAAAPAALPGDHAHQRGGHRLDFTPPAAVIR